MSTGDIANRLMSVAGSDGANGHELIVGVEAEKSRAIAEIQAALTVAQARPRNEQRCLDRIANACQRQGLAERSQYSYSRGGTEITGPSIDLLTVVANCWGNIQFGFRELSQSNGQSEVEAFAWDLESNSKRAVTFTVKHERVARSKVTRLTDPRDIYELVANYAQRRVRACLESVIPPDVVDAALDQCVETLKTKDPVTPEKIKKLVDAFADKYQVTTAQIEVRLGRRVETMTPAQMVQMRRIWKSLEEGMSQVGDWFKPIEDDQPAKTETKKSVKDKLKEGTLV